MSHKIFKSLLVFSLLLSLSACGSYNKDVTLTPEEKANLEKTLAASDQQLKTALEEFHKEQLKAQSEAKDPAANPVTTDPTTATPAPDATPPTPTSDATITDQATQNPDLIDLYVTKYRAQRDLGQIDDAIKTLKEGLAEMGGVSTVLWHNLAKLYEDAGDCESAETYYVQLIETAGLSQYYYDIAHCYFKSAPKPVFSKIEENYLKYLKFSFQPDSEIEDYLKANKK